MLTGVKRINSQWWNVEGNWIEDIETINNTQLTTTDCMIGKSVANKMDLQLYYAHYRNIYNLDKLEDISGYLSFANSYGDFDFYNGVVWHRNSVNWENYFDLTSSISWDINEDLTVTLKGDNLLNKAKKTSQFTYNPVTYEPGSLEISPIDQRITIELEYMF